MEETEQTAFLEVPPKAEGAEEVVVVLAALLSWSRPPTSPCSALSAWMVVPEGLEERAPWLLDQMAMTETTGWCSSTDTDRPTMNHILLEHASWKKRILCS